MKLQHCPVILFTEHKNWHYFFILQKVTIIHELKIARCARSSLAERQPTKISTDTRIADELFWMSMKLCQFGNYSINQNNDKYDKITPVFAVAFAKATNLFKNEEAAEMRVYNDNDTSHIGLYQMVIRNA